MAICVLINFSLGIACGCWYKNRNDTQLNPTLTMKAVFYSRDHNLICGEIPEPVAGPEEVLVHVHYAGICGSDLHLYRSRMLPEGAIMGHEVSGRIATLGGAVTERKVGDRVIVRPAGCGFCPACQERRENLCPQRRAIGLGRNPGGYAEKLSVPWGMTIPVPEGVPLAQASLTDPLATGLHAIRLARPLARKTALIIGSGAIGLSLLLLLRREGAQSILVSEPELTRQEMAYQLGADVIFHPQDPEAQAKIQTLTEGRGPDTIFECSGNANAFQQALIWIGKAGEIILVGLGPEPFSFSPGLAVLKEVKILSSFANTQEECREILEMIRQGAVLAEPLTRDRIFLEELPMVFQELLAGSGRIKVIVAMKGEE